MAFISSCTDCCLKSVFCRAVFLTDDVLSVLSGVSGSTVEQDELEAEG